MKLKVTIELDVPEEYLELEAGDILQDLRFKMIEMPADLYSSDSAFSQVLRRENSHLADKINNWSKILRKGTISVGI